MSAEGNPSKESHEIKLRTELVRFAQNIVHDLDDFDVRLVGVETKNNLPSDLTEDVEKAREIVSEIRQKISEIDSLREKYDAAVKS